MVSRWIRVISSAVVLLSSVCHSDSGPVRAGIAKADAVHRPNLLPGVRPGHPISSYQSLQCLKGIAPLPVVQAWPTFDCTHYDPYMSRLEETVAAGRDFLVRHLMP